MEPLMEYRNLGPTSLKVSVISYGNWLNSNSEDAKKLTKACVKKAWDLGINFFDTAQVYGQGQAEIQLGQALKELNVPRHQYVLSTKIFWTAKIGSEQIPNTNGLSRKHIIQGTKNSLKKLNHEFVDIIFCHRYDNQTPMEETCRAYDWLIRKGYTSYWGTSQWNEEEIAEAHYICKKYKLIKPIAEQPQYNIFNREKMELGYRNLFRKNKMGTTIWSPLLSGILTGKYNKGIPQQSRFEKFSQIMHIFKRYFEGQNKEKTLQKLNKFAQLAKTLNCSMAQLALAWCINNPDVSTAITGASSPSQLEETVKAVEVRKLLTNEVQQKIEAIFENTPEGPFHPIRGRNQKSRRLEVLGL